ncbi:phosphatase PAP2 family protein [Demequina capsici]|uniref:Phosphatase PAP2 family protein n=1 Tax=Demequina capsici TaxID=3075620 RepID=A0AA96FD64_9MICO|nr:phosphatase PAP2 family protein [Demequina sp. PMTSA13]WNM27728.1 phosphatase PAP2 family protein [Demequina sp. PMTSA13]
MRVLAVVRATLPGLLIAALGMWVFAALLEGLLEKGDLYVVDQPVVDWLAAHRQPWLTGLLTAVTDTFGPVILPVAVGVGGVVWGVVTGRWREPVLLVAAMAVSIKLALVLKTLVGRPRPADSLQVVPGLESSASFPSGHTTAAATLVLVLGYLMLRRRWSAHALLWWAVISVVVVGTVASSRLYLGYHFVTDVMAGACLGVVALGGVIVVDRWLDLWEGRAEQATRSAPAGLTPGESR